MEHADLKQIAEFDMLDPKRNIIKIMNKAAIIGFIVCGAAGLLLNYCLRMLGEAGGSYAIWTICGLALCLVYIYLHELTHAVAIIIIKHKKPTVKFGALAAYCGSPDIMFGKAGYFFVASAPLVVFAAILVPLCVILPSEFFPLAFLPLVYDVFGSMGDVYMIHRALKIPRGGVIIDSGASVKMYVRVEENEK